MTSAKKKRKMKNDEDWMNVNGLKGKNIRDDKINVNKSDNVVRRWR